MKWEVVVKRWAYRVLGGQGVGLEGPRGSSGRPKGSQGVKGGQGVGLQGPSGSRGRQVLRLTFKSEWVGETD